MGTAYFSLVVSQLINFLKLQKQKASYFVNKFSANNFLFLKRKAPFQVVFILLIFVFLTSNVNAQARTGGFWDGRLDDIVIFHRALTADQLKTLHQ